MLWSVTPLRGGSEHSPSESKVRPKLRSWKPTPDVWAELAGNLNSELGP